MKADHGLDDRKLKILQTIIKTYLETGEPVGSRTISKYTDLNLSSATIRNEMADLEDLGYIIQPHTSAGRIPSDRGYRLYVDMLMEDKEHEITEMQEKMLQKADKMEQLLQQAARVLANSTNYATMVSAPTYNRNKLKFIQLSQVDANQIIAVIVMEGNIIKNKIVAVAEPLDNETMLKLNMLLNTNLNGIAVEDINLGMIARLKEQAGIHSGVISDVLDAVANTIQLDNDLEIYTSGATNIFKYPELLPRFFRHGPRKFHYLDFQLSSVQCRRRGAHATCGRARQAPHDVRVGAGPLRRASLRSRDTGPWRRRR